MDTWIKKIGRKVEPLVQHKRWGVPIFLVVLLLMFNISFWIGSFFTDQLIVVIDYIVLFLRRTLPEGAAKSLLVDGIINGVGEILLFVPNLVMLNLFISLMEDSGYMHRVVKLIDKAMHKIGLHGESLVSLVLGFSCNVPAVLSTSKVTNRGSRLIAMLIIPLMTCSARLPVFLAFSAILFPGSSGFVLFSLYLLGVLLAILMARIFKIFLYDEREEISTYSTLVPYKLPTIKGTLAHIWEKTSEYLKSIFGVVLVASVLLWVLSYYPRPKEELSSSRQLEQSYIGEVGKFIQPALAPLGFDWKTSVALLSGIARKELVLSSIMVLYDDGNSEEKGISSLPERLTSLDPVTQKPPFTPLSAYTFLVFILISFPCISTLITISRESGNWLWGGFAMVYTTALAWCVSFVVFQVGGML